MAIQVYFIGAGPGDPELLTLKGKKIIDLADVIIYADSLVNPGVCANAKEDAKIYGSSTLTLEEIISLIVEAVNSGKTVARIQTGDPSVYGAIYEQMAALDAQGIEYEVVPGVSSIFAAIAALKAEFTVPELSQTLIVTRIEGRTPVPEPERLRSLAIHHTSMGIFLSTSLAEKVSIELIAGGYAPETPAAVVYRASWPDQRIIRTNLENLARDIENAGLTKQALILVGDFLNAADNKRRSKLYDGKFTHEYRR